MERRRSEDDFDIDAEVQNFHTMGFVFASALVHRAERVHQACAAAGWDGARELVRDTFRGHEADFLAAAMRWL